MTQIDPTGIRDAAEMTIQQAKDMLTNQLDPGSYEQKRDELNDLASALSSLLNEYENEMEAKRKMKRAIDDDLADLKMAARPLENLKKDVQEYAKRMNNAFWDTTKEKQSRNLKSSES